MSEKHTATDNECLNKKFIANDCINIQYYSVSFLFFFMFVAFFVGFWCTQFWIFWVLASACCCFCCELDVWVSVSVFDGKLQFCDRQRLVCCDSVPEICCICFFRSSQFSMFPVSTQWVSEVDDRRARIYLWAFKWQLLKRENSNQWNGVIVIDHKP